MIKQFLTYGNVFSAIEHSVDENTSEKIYLLQLQKKKKELIVIAKEQFNILEELTSQIESQKHVFLIINNQQVLFKEVLTQEQNHEHLAKIAFPSVKLSDFYYEVIQHPKKSFVAICRKEYVNTLIDTYNKKGIPVIDFSLHSFALQALVPYLNQDEVYTSNAIISLENTTIDRFEKQSTSEKEYTINNLEVSNHHVLSLAGVISYYSKTSNSLNNYSELQQKLAQNYKGKRFYVLGLKTALGTVFCVLLLNFVFFSQARSKGVHLKAQIEANSSYKSTLIQLQDRVDKKNELVNSLTSLSTTKTTSYINELGKSIPKTLQLTELKFQPLAKSIKKNKEIVVDKNTFLVKGTSRNNNDFSNWIASLELKNWIQKVVTVSHGKGKSTTSEFEFIITTKN